MMSLEENREATLETFRCLAEQAERLLRERRIDEAVRTVMEHIQPAWWYEGVDHPSTYVQAYALRVQEEIRAEYRRIVEREEGRA